MSVGSVLSAVHEYSGASFFSGWEFYGKPEGNTNFLNHTDAIAQHLINVTESGTALIKVDNSATVSDVSPVRRNSVRIISADSYPIGSSIIMDAVHVPYGCSVRGNFWMADSEIMQNDNITKMRLHTNECVPPEKRNIPQRSGHFDYSSQGRLAVDKKNPDTLAQNQSGVYAAHLSVAGVFIWYWDHPNIPKSISSAVSGSSIDNSDWGMPMSRQVHRVRGPQRLVLDIGLCAAPPCRPWPAIDSDMCPSDCVSGNVVRNGRNFDAAFFEINYIRTYIYESRQQPSSTSSERRSSASPPSCAQYSIMVSTKMSWSTIFLWAFWLGQIAVGFAIGIIILLKVSGNWTPQE
ncbi:hypothetical protein C8R44DRAFT_766406 [Mycena epipterygia]|nr:hypothetical protein C8R44DRAFT_766406 [Mycena epipterygia]